MRRRAGGWWRFGCRSAHRELGVESIFRAKDQAGSGQRNSRHDCRAPTTLTLRARHYASGCKQRSDCPQKLTKTAGPLARRLLQLRSTLGGHVTLDLPRKPTYHRLTPVREGCEMRQLLVLAMGGVISIAAAQLMPPPPAKVDPPAPVNLGAIATLHGAPYVYEVSGVLIGVPARTLIRIDAAAGSCCLTCQSICKSECTVTTCQDSACCTYTSDTDATDASGHFKFFVEPGRYRLTAQIQDRRVVISDKLEITRSQILQPVSIPTGNR
jgi:hypothetical protein